MRRLRGQFLAVELDSNNGGLNLVTAKIEGPFKSRRALNDWIRRESLDCFQHDEDVSANPEDLEKWGSDVLVCEIRRVVRPVPVMVIKKTMRIKDVEE